jgi:hypothetical protein
LKVGAEQCTPHLVPEWAIASGELLHECVTADERVTSDVECIESMMRETSCVHESLLARSPGPRPPERRSRDEAERREGASRGASARIVRVREGPGAEGEEAGVRGCGRGRGRGLGGRVGRPRTERSDWLGMLDSCVFRAHLSADSGRT